MLFLVFSYHCSRWIKTLRDNRKNSALAFSLTHINLCPPPLFCSQIRCSSCNLSRGACFPTPKKFTTKSTLQANRQFATNEVTSLWERKMSQTRLDTSDGGGSPGGAAAARLREASQWTLCLSSHVKVIEREEECVLAAIQTQHHHHHHHVDGLTALTVHPEPERNTLKGEWARDSCARGPGEEKKIWVVVPPIELCPFPPLFLFRWGSRIIDHDYLVKSSPDCNLEFHTTPFSFSLFLYCLQ